MTITEAETVPLSRLLREGSQAEHTAAEGASFMSELLAGRVSARGYADYLGALVEVYAALESVGHRLRDAGDPLAGAVLDPALERGAALRADVAHWGPGELRGGAVAAYVERIRAAETWGGSFVAHHYTRYLGDLSGGRAIGRILRREFDLADAGAAFYDFPAIPKPKPYKDAYRERLDALPLSADEREAVLTEVKVVFSLNGAIFAELSGRLDLYRR